MQGGHMAADFTPAAIAIAVATAFDLLGRHLRLATRYQRRGTKNREAELSVQR